jgi:hypothetical protein
MKTPTSLFFGLIASTAMLLSACGGGGSSTPAAAEVALSADTFQIRTALANYFTDSRSLRFTVSGTTSAVSVTGSGTVTQSSVSGATFEGTPALQKVSTITGSLSVNGVTVPLAATDISYVDSNYNPRGNAGDEYVVVTGSATVPTTAKVNDTGVVFSAKRYTSSAKTGLLGTQVLTFAIQPETSTTALLKLIEVEKDNAGNTTTTSTITFRLTPAGAMTRLSETAVSGTTALTLTYL